jgi:hypothetical protein
VIAWGRTCCITAGAFDGVLPATLQRLALLRIVIWVLPEGLRNEIAYGTCPIDIVGCLLGNRYHGRLGRHGRGIMELWLEVGLM